MVDFNVVVDLSFAEFCRDEAVQPKSNKRLKSLVNEFEDGAWRSAYFHHFIWDNVAETALSKTERDALVDKPSTLLARAAENLRHVSNSTKSTEGSELAEILLYGLMKREFGALSVVPKIFYKQNVKDNAKGADSVHVIVTDKDYSLWFGEAKFYNSIADARLNEIVASVKASLQTEKLKKENRTIVDLDYLDDFIADSEMVQNIREALDASTSIDKIKAKINIPILILHECPITAAANDCDQEYLDAIKELHLERATSYFKKQIQSLSGEIHKYSDIKFHLILFPVPNKKAIVDKYFKKLAHHKEDEA